MDPEADETLTVSEIVIAFSDILCIEYAGPGEDIFRGADDDKSSSNTET